MSGDREPSILWVDEIDTDLTSVAGPKIAKLGELRSLALDIPRGFVVTTHAFTDVVGTSELAAAIDARLTGVSPSEHRRVGDAARAIRTMIGSQPLPAGLRSAIITAYDELCRMCGTNTPTAVRSSATGEDSTDASFAGQFDTYLGVTGAEAVVDAVKSCWASLFTDRALAYRLERGVDHRECPMAVGVLELIEARASGVAFSVHPVTGRSDRIVIEGSWGWGEAIVGGLVTPDRVEIGKTDDRVLDYVVSHKAVMSDFDRRAGIVTEVEVPPEIRDVRVIEDHELSLITAAVRLIEEHFGHAVDVEWVLSHDNDRSRVTIVQARPETVHGPGGGTEGVKWDPAGYAMKYAFGTEDSP